MKLQVTPYTPTTPVQLLGSLDLRAFYILVLDRAYCTALKHPCRFASRRLSLTPPSSLEVNLADWGAAADFNGTMSSTGPSVLIRRLLEELEQFRNTARPTLLANIATPSTLTLIVLRRP